MKTLTGSDLWVYLYEQTADPNASAEVFVEGLRAFVRQKSWIVIAMALVQLLLSPVLMLGFIHAILTLMRGGTVTYRTAFARLDVFWRAVGLSALTSLKVALWALPSVVLMVIAVFLLYWTESVGLYIFMAIVASILMMVLTIRAAYRYAMAPFFLADEPDTGVLTCVRQSKTVMKKRKLQLFMLEMVYLMGSLLAANVIMMLLPGVIGTTVSMMVQLIFTVYLYGVRCAFFEGCVHPGSAVPRRAPADTHDDEMKDLLN